VYGRGEAQFLQRFFFRCGVVSGSVPFGIGSLFFLGLVPRSPIHVVFSWFLIPDENYGHK
jgi:hypothetical protein